MAESTNSIHLIDENKQYNNQLGKYIANCHPNSNDDGLNYHIVSVFGSQSSGKSTLLNRLFGTKFDVMDEIKRQQTTKGIWFSYANHISSSESINENSNNIFVLDVEGADGRERADDKDFERKAALFALSTSEVLIINIWENQIGLYQGANMELLKTVLEVNLTLFHSNKQKILLLFVIRDFSGGTLMENLIETLSNDMNKIWDSLNKPEGSEDFKLSDFFDLDFFSIGHKRFQPEKFESDINELGDKFLDDLFKVDYHRGIPIDAWGIYSEQIWDQIQENKDLDLPTQQILVSRFRCDEILNDSFDKFNDEFLKFDFKEIDEDDDLIINKLKELRDAALSSYDSNAHRYNENVYSERRSTLSVKIDNQLKSIHESQIGKFKRSIFLSLPNLITSEKKESKSKDFSEIFSGVSNNLIDEFTRKLKLFEISENFSIDDNLGQFKIELNDKIGEIKTKEQSNLISRLTRNFQRKLKEFVIDQLNTPKDDTWDLILDEFKSIEKNSLSKFTNDEKIYDFKLGLSLEANNESLNSIKKSYWVKFYDIIHDYLSEDTVSRIIRNVFENTFKFDDKGLPKIWSSVDEIDKSFTEARSISNKVLPILSCARLVDNSEIIPDVDISHPDDDDDDDEEGDLEPNHSFAHLLTSRQQNKVRDRFKRESDAIYIDAKRSIISNISSIPYYIYLIILVLGWNEFMMILRNPLLITLTILLVTGTYFAYNTNTLMPILSVLKVSLNHSKEMAKERLREMLNDDVQKTEIIEMDDLKK